MAAGASPAVCRVASGGLGWCVDNGWSHKVGRWSAGARARDVLAECARLPALSRPWKHGLQLVQAAIQACLLATLQYDIGRCQQQRP